MRSIIPWLALAASLWTGACGKVLPIHYYDIRYPAPAPMADNPKYQKTLAIAHFTASATYRQSRILYREGASSSKVGFYDDRRWIAPPTELLTQAAVLHFRNLHMFANVIPYTDRSGSEYILRVRITELEEVDLTDAYYGKISLFAELISTDKEEVIWSAPISVTRRTTARNVDTIVQEITQGVGEALQSLALAIDQALAITRAVGKQSQVPH